MQAPTAAGLLALPDDHPGVSDVAYRQRRAAIAAVGEAHVPGAPIPTVAYAPEEDAVWRTVSSELGVLHETLAVEAYRSGVAALALPTDVVPQLGPVSERLTELTGWSITPVPGLVPTRTFYGALAERRFCSTQYIRHHSVPFYTPEPDVVHELIGHANALAEPRFAGLYELAGQASLRCETDAALEAFSRVFWFSLEFGVAWEDGELRAYGAGLLSSYGEVQAFRSAEVRPLDVAAMATLDYDITQYQPVLFAADSFAHAHEVLATFFAGWDDDAHHRLLAGG
ncbi:phenylalanine 4-monooxygenase [Iamia sp. SCSIO 61187]|uniref:phenylalanine 4-monooxygenase n=1 Tax=Iamia sp. SCSIO 61187 TaxID=2722752 RepID=UPI001C62D4C4|nr:phenylalanine 4-monooxygenase [Iamia sp. SCSIO 61187]QYG93792.1 phenylalanine 4-monooxygenase [Iamia sp. SCSIO 61187]